MFKNNHEITGTKLHDKNFTPKSFLKLSSVKVFFLQLRLCFMHIYVIKFKMLNTVEVVYFSRLNN